MPTSKAPVPDDLPEVPTAEQVQDALDVAIECREKVENYIAVAEEVDARHTSLNEGRRISLDDLPYGEDLLRVRPLTDPLEGAEEAFRKLLEAVTNVKQRVSLAAAQAVATFEQAEKTVREAAATLDDCTDLPPEDADDDLDGDDDFDSDMDFGDDNDDDGR